MSTRLGDVVEPQSDLTRSVCVWLGQHLVVNHLTDPMNAAEFELVMRQRFASLRVTNEPADTSEMASVLPAPKRAADLGERVALAPSRSICPRVSGIGTRSCLPRGATAAECPSCIVRPCLSDATPCTSHSIQAGARVPGWRGLRDESGLRQPFPNGVGSERGYGPGRRASDALGKREPAQVQPGQEMECDGRNPQTGAPCLLGYHQGPHRDAVDTEWLDE
ncbi:hypothetical protein GCM10009745_76560 [Kribbella yunnanensis]|uniref:Uncharacterized protein n=1 Tax=Kribbella yunnanensis TaxID=190194 RepID=A0ABP4V2M1_9ACTN